MTEDLRIFPLGDSALTVEFGTAISVDLNRKSIALAEHFQNHPFSGFVEAVPAYASTTLFYDPIAVRKSASTDATSFAAVEKLVASALSALNDAPAAATRVIEISATFDGDAAPDLTFIAERAGLAPNDVIDIFLAETYRVYMLGFLPGFSYMGDVDERIATPRKETPRTAVPKGSIGIAGRQTGIYSLESPGGWQLIGRTDVRMFDPDSDEPAYLQPGDSVKFIRT